MTYLEVLRGREKAGRMVVVEVKFHVRMGGVMKETFLVIT